MRRFLAPALAAALLLPTFAFAANAPAKLGEKAPDFSVEGVDGKTYTLESFKDAEAVVVLFTCTTCPVVKNYEERVAALAKKYKGKAAVVGISCNNATESVEKLKAYAEKNEKISYPYAFDANAASAKAYGAKATPHAFVLNKDREIVYSGAIDDSMSNPETNYVDEIVGKIVAGEEVEPKSTKAVGCSLKMKR